VVPCAVLALCIHPTTSHNLLNRISWAFCVYLEAVSVLPQLRVMQNTKIVEPFTAHYVFALGVARFLSCAHWVLQMLVDAFNLILCQHKCFCVEGKPSVLDSRGRLLVALGYGLWPSMVLISEICLWRAACSPSTLWGGLSEDAILLCTFLVTAISGLFVNFGMQKLWASNTIGTVHEIVTVVTRLSPSPVGRFNGCPCDGIDVGIGLLHRGGRPSSHGY
ncbi:hypothetical protein Gotri_022944, partial [Gossypium trilobum]|nr:hypothetical protein [Gossypium trilobum]